jgi:glycerophosphoryl diester phosphodiesterase
MIMNNSLSEEMYFVAHRGGIVEPNSPENSKRALLLAKEAGFKMVEIDLNETKDHLPILHHNLNVDFLDNALIRNLYHDFLLTCCYPNTQEKMISFEQCLGFCNELNMDIMLDFKIDKNHPPSEEFFLNVAKIISDSNYRHRLLCIKLHPFAIKYLQNFVMFELNKEQMKNILGDKTVKYRDNFCFSRLKVMSTHDIQAYKEQTAQLIVTVNRDHYKTGNHFKQAEAHLKQLYKNGVTGFQIDSEYLEIFNHL